MSRAAVPRLLLVEPNAESAMLMRQTLREHFGQDCVTPCATLAGAAEQDIDNIDLVIADMDLPDGTGLELLDRLLQDRPDIPVILAASHPNRDEALHAIAHGAYDYICKNRPFLFTLPIIVEKNLAMWRTKAENLRLQLQVTHSLEEVRVKNTQLENAVRQLETAASTDPLTGLANRRAFNQAFERCFSACDRYGHDLTCIMIDLDGFKAFNDSRGHQAGDSLLTMLSRVLEANCRRSDVAGRYGGDEFILLLPETDLATARLVAKRVSDEFAVAVSGLAKDASGMLPSVSMSMGLATLRHANPENPEQMIAMADHALYRAKQSGRNRMVVYTNAADAKSAPSATALPTPLSAPPPKPSAALAKSA